LNTSQPVRTRPKVRQPVHKTGEVGRGSWPMSVLDSLARPPIHGHRLCAVAWPAQHRQLPALVSAETHGYYVVSGQIGSFVRWSLPAGAPVPVDGTMLGHNSGPAFLLSVGVRPLLTLASRVLGLTNAGMVGAARIQAKGAAIKAGTECHD
jgi:hypothetical protein